MASLFVVAAGVWLLLFSAWAQVRTLEVSGLERVTYDQIEEVTGSYLGQPILMVDEAAAAGQLRKIDLISNAQVAARWNGELFVSIQERTAVVVVASTAGGKRQWQSIDRDGVVIETSPAAPAGLPLADFSVPIDSQELPALRAMVRALTDLPDRVRSQVRTSGATSVDGIWFTLEDGTTVRWGSADNGARKAEVLLGVMNTPARTYDVSSPENPALVLP